MTISLGEFELESPIGRGGMAVVWRARHIRQDVPVAVKLMTADLGRRGEYRQRFFEEVRSVARLHHPGVVMVLDVGECGAAAATQLGVPRRCPYLAMELVEPGALSQNPPQTWSAIGDVVRQVLAALAHAHARGVIHRDIKPDNILVADDHAKLSDFGLAWLADDACAVDADSDRVTGTPKYMAPEQILGALHRQGPWTDLYGLGCIVWRLVCGSTPHGGADQVEILQSHLRRPLPAFEPSIAVPARLGAWLRRLLARRPEDRYQRAADALAAFAEIGEPVRPAGGETARSVVDQDTQPTHLTDTLPELGAAASESTVITDSGAIVAHEQLDADKPTGGDRLERVKPRVPETWQSQVHPPPPMQLLGAGLGLYGLRPVPFVGRTQERDQIWEAIRSVAQRGRPQVAVVSGASGRGKSRLVSWIGQRADQVGAAIVLRATHGSGGAQDGLAGMLARHFGSIGLSRQACVERIGSALLRRGYGADEALYDAMTFADMIANPEADSAERPSATQRHLALARVFQTFGAQRPVYLWLDDIQWGRDSLRFVQWLMRQRRDIPMLVVMTAMTEAVDDALGERLGALAEASGGCAIDVRALDASDHRRLVGGLLGLDEQLCERVIQRTRGNPLFAVQLVGDWVERGVLEVSQGGFRLAEGEQASMPDDVHRVCVRRIDWALGRLDADQREQARRSLEVAAALGRSVSRDEWLDACERLDLAPPDQLLDPFANAGVIRVEPEGWSFAHGMFRESLERLAQKAGRQQAHHRACARALESGPRAFVRRQAPRRARHWRLAGDFDSAAAALLEAAGQHADTSAYDRLSDALDEREALLDKLEVGPEDRRRVDGWLLRARAAGESGRGDDFAAMRAHIEDVVQRQGWKDLYARIRSFGAIHESTNGNMEEAVRLAREAFVLSKRHGQAAQVTQAQFHLGQCLMMVGRFEQSRRLIEAAMEEFVEAGDRDGQGRALARLGGIAINQGQFDLARRHLREAAEIAEANGSRQRLGIVLTHLGDIARDRSDLEEASSSYRRATALWESIGSAMRFVGQLRQVWVAFGRGDYAQSAQLEAVGREAEQSAKGYLLRYVRLGQAVCTGAAGDWSHCRSHLHEAEAMIADSADANRDLVYVADILADLARGRGRQAIAARAEALAASQRDILAADT